MHLHERTLRLATFFVLMVLALPILLMTPPSVSSTSDPSTGACPQGYPCGPQNPNQLTDESIGEPYDSLDPGSGFFLSDVFFPSVFQELVEFNPYNVTDVVPALASKWTVGGGPLYERSPNYYTQWNFTMRDNIWFSNGDPINAYVIWFSLVRELYMNSPDGVGYTNYVSITFNASDPLDVTSHGNVFPDGLQNALASAGLCVVNPTNDSGCVRALNTMLSNFDWHNSTQLKVMSYPDQAYVAISSSAFQINTIQPYPLTLLTLPGQWGAAVDPAFIDSRTECAESPCGGVQNNTQPEYFSQNGMPGSGPYMYGNHTGNIELTLNNNTDYWGRGVTGLPPNLQPAKIPTIKLLFAVNTSLADFQTNKAQIVSPDPSNFSGLWTSYHSEYPSVPFDSVYKNLGFSLCEYSTAMNTQYSNYTSYGYEPVNYTNVRQALVHAVNYTEILDQLYSVPNPTNGSLLQLGELYLPPIPPGFGDLSNPQNIPLYSFNISLAQQLIAKAGAADGFYVTLQNGTNLGDSAGHLFNSLTYAYFLPNSSSTVTLVKIMNSGFNQLGISVHPYGLNFTTQYLPDSQSPTTTPPLTEAGWCSDWPDPIYQDFYDLGTTVAHQPNWVNNTALTALLEKISFEPYLGLQVQQTEQAYSIFTQLATLLQLPDPANYIWQQPYLQNATFNPTQLAFYYDMMSYGYQNPSTTTQGGNSGRSILGYYGIIGGVAVVAGGGLLAFIALSRSRARGASTVSAIAKRRLAAIMFTDMVGYTSLGQQNEALSLELVEEQRKLVRPILAKHNGREVKTMGDAFLVEFASALEAVKCAYEIQNSARELNKSVPEERQIHLRIGVHLGDVVESQGDISGDAVNISSRVESLAEDGGVCITRQIFDQVSNKFEHPIQSIGFKTLKNVKAPQEIYKIMMPWDVEPTWEDDQEKKSI